MQSLENRGMYLLLEAGSQVTFIVLIANSVNQASCNLFSVVPKIGNMFKNLPPPHIKPQIITVNIVSDLGEE